MYTTALQLLLAGWLDTRQLKLLALSNSGNLELCGQHHAHPAPNSLTKANHKRRTKRKPSCLLCSRSVLRYQSANTASVRISRRAQQHFIRLQAGNRFPTQSTPPRAASARLVILALRLLIDLAWCVSTTTTHWCVSFSYLRARHHQHAGRSIRLLVTLTRVTQRRV